jgi:hypothetical protein
MTYTKSICIKEISDPIEILARLLNKWGLKISISEWSEGNNLLVEVPKACLFLEPGNEEHEQIIHNRKGYFLFETEEEMERAFLQCVGDDGPTELNKYNGPVRVYAVTCSPIGGILNENT